MKKEYDLKLNPIIKDIIDLYNEIDPIKRYKTAAGRIKPLIFKEINRILDFLNSERENNAELQILLKEGKYKGIIKLLDDGIRF